MASRKIKPGQLGEAINEILNEYANEVVESSKEAVISTGKMALKVAQAHASQIGRGKYARSLTMEEGADTGRVYMGTSVTIYSKQYRLAHLLEHGHVLKVRGKVRGVTRAFPHFAPAEQYAIQMLPEKIKQVIQRG